MQKEIRFLGSLSERFLCLHLVEIKADRAFDYALKSCTSVMLQQIGNETLMDSCLLHEQT